jgi:hypothetical protein
VTGLWLRIRLFFSSYAPLFAIAALRFPSTGLKVACGILCVFGLTTACLVVRAAAKIEPDPMTVEEVSDLGAEVAGYLATYLLPFVVVPDPSASDLIAYALFLAIAGAVYVQSDMLQINPTLYLARYRVFAVRTSDDWEGYLISRVRPERGATLLASRLQNTVALARPTRRDDPRLAT